jgi:predicted PurR-regulated permease PerM
MVAGGVILWFAGQVFLLFFTGILLAAFLAGIAGWLTEHTRLSYRWALTITVLVLLSLTTAGVMVMAPELTRQFTQLSEELPKAWEHFRNYLNQSAWGRQALLWLPEMPKALMEIPSGLSRASGFLSSIFGILANVFVVLFVGLYLAMEPGRYAEGLVGLWPRHRRPRLRQVFTEMGITLQRWLIGRLLLMAINAVVTAAGLYFLGAPLPITMGILSGLLNFIPNFGPILAAAPAVLLAFTKGPSAALYVGLFYLVYQMIDGYVLTPLLERRTVLMPPALTIMTQVLMGVLAGAMGVVLADPLLAAVLVMVKMLYIEDVLGERVELPGQSNGRDKPG